MQSQFKEPIDLLVSEDHYNACPFDGSRTDLLEIREGYSVECCSQCNKLFNFWDE
jgi:hypothetical protein